MDKRNTLINSLHKLYKLLTMADTETSFLYADPFIPWYQSATGLQGFLWVEQDGKVIGGSQTVASAVAPTQSGDTQADLATWITAAVQSLMSAPVFPDFSYSFGNVLGIGPWGVATGVRNGRKAVALAYYNNFTFNFTPPMPNGYQHPRIFKFRIVDTGFGNSDTVNPTVSFIEQYETDHAGASPILLVLEPVQQ